MDVKEIVKLRETLNKTYIDYNKERAKEMRPNGGIR